MNLNLIPSVYAAQDVVGKLELPSVKTNLTSISPFITGIITTIVVVAGLFSFWQLLMGGLGYITGGGDKGKIQEAQNKIFMAITGMVIIAGSFLIAGLVGQILFGRFDALFNPGEQLQIIK